MSESYWDQFIEESIPEIKEMESEAMRDHVPIMEEDGIAFLKQMIRIKQPKTILEIGAAIGYSAIQMHFAAPDSQIVTIERDQDRFERARYYISKFDLQDKIDLQLGDALADNMNYNHMGPFDVIFIDAAKGKYKQFFEKAEQLLSTNGVIITDNVLFKGYVQNPELASKRLSKVAQKIDHYNKWLMSHPDFETIIVPVGDGISLSTKR
ncbi:Predicted O-methyltransferase YrrM [Pelagirhabdus alkalitolerans]|uniref:tRNA 5-hydroxyuridine methyltransferase n=1 Tax=Pelagirhabdus alkalitolerans TaxID=1612202 RepID=A0A1G6HV07_9BACI|nr:O-methyltransferase [Pelagirhabdus alkalitolerans]SDB97306.1 Predicted O-methyltransferase YrrM [Pelagirhabdus alkalitolerans]